LAGLVRDERHHIEHAEPGVGTGVAAQVEKGKGGAGQRPGGLGHQVDGAGESEDRPVVIRVAVPIEQSRAGGSRNATKDRFVAALADVDHALEEHDASVTRRKVCPGQARRRRPAQRPPGVSAGFASGA
jgi:hypothetical protein